MPNIAGCQYHNSVSYRMRLEGNGQRDSDAPNFFSGSRDLPAPVRVIFSSIKGR
jgi:hypothetical protein